MSKERIELERDPHITFYYNRTERLKRMPQSQKLYDGELKQKGGILKSLTGTKQNRTLFLTIVFLCAVAITVSFWSSKPYQGLLNGIPIKISAFLFEDNVYVTFDIEAQKKISVPKPFAVTFIALDKEKNPIEIKEANGIYSGIAQKAQVKFSDYDIFSVAAKINMEDFTQTVSINIDRKH